MHEEDGKPFELEMSWLCEESGWKHARVSLSTPSFSPHFRGHANAALALLWQAERAFPQQLPVYHM